MHVPPTHFTGKSQMSLAGHEPCWPAVPGHGSMLFTQCSPAHCEFCVQLVMPTYGPAVLSKASCKRSWLSGPTAVREHRPNVNATCPRLPVHVGPPPVPGSTLIGGPPPTHFAGGV